MHDSIADLGADPSVDPITVPNTPINAALREVLAAGVDSMFDKLMWEKRKKLLSLEQALKLMRRKKPLSHRKFLRLISTILTEYSRGETIFYYDDPNNIKYSLAKMFVIHANTYIGNFVECDHEYGPVIDFMRDIIMAKSIIEMQKFLSYFEYDKTLSDEVTRGREIVNNAVKSYKATMNNISSTNSSPDPLHLNLIAAIAKIVVN
jgi:hypothetical protein